jgi:hypothetical protein
VVEPTHRWRSPLVGGVRAGGGACSSVDEPVCWWRSLCVDGARSPVEELTHRWSRTSVAVLRMDGCGRVSGGSWVGGEPWRMWVCPRRCRGVAGPGRSPRRTHPRRGCWPATVAWTAHRCAVLRRDGHGSVGGESWAGRSRGGWGAPADDVASGGLVEP